MAITKTVTVLLEVREAPDFFPSVSPGSLVVFKGEMAFYYLTFSVNSTFTGRIRLSIASAMPAGSYVFDTTNIGPGETATLGIDTNLISLGQGSIDIVFEEIV